VTPPGTTAIIAVTAIAGRAYGRNPRQACAPPSPLAAGIVLLTANGRTHLLWLIRRARRVQAIRNRCI
jgi:hypothetical protein